MLVSPPRLAPRRSPGGGLAPAPQAPSPRVRLPRETWSFGLALAAVLVVKAGWVTSVPW